MSTFKYLKISSLIVKTNIYEFPSPKEIKLTSNKLTIKKKKNVNAKFQISKIFLPKKNSKILVFILLKIM